MILDRILKTGSRISITRGRPTYRPYGTLPRYRGKYPFPTPRGIKATTNAFSPASATSKLYALRASSPRSTNYLYEDRRLWTPKGQDWPRSKTTSNTRVTDRYADPYREYGPPRTPFGEPLKLVPSKVDPSGWTYIPDRPGVLEKAKYSNYGFENPWKVIICLKRKMRREVMNALGYAGKTGFQKPKYTQFSYVRCY